MHLVSVSIVENAFVNMVPRAVSLVLLKWNVEKPGCISYMHPATASLA